MKILGGLCGGREMVRIKPAESVRRMPDLWEPNYAFMLKTQKGIAYYFHTQGRPVKCSEYYEKKAQEEETEKRRQAMEEFHRQTTQARQRWEGYLAMHPTEAITFPWRSLLGTPPAIPLVRSMIFIQESMTFPVLSQRGNCFGR